MIVERHQAEVQHQPACVEAIRPESIAIVQQAMCDAVSDLRTGRVEEDLVDVERQLRSKHGFDVGAMITEQR